MSYRKIGWKDFPETDTPISASNLNHMDEGIAAAHASIGDTPITYGDSLSEAVNNFGAKIGTNNINTVADGTVTGAIKEMDNKLSFNGKDFYFDIKEGQFGFNTDAARGADTFIPFKSMPDFKISIPLTIKGSASVNWTSSGNSSASKAGTIELVMKDGQLTASGGNLSASGTSGASDAYTRVSVSSTVGNPTIDME